MADKKFFHISFIIPTVFLFVAFKVKMNWPILQKDGEIENAKLNLFATRALLTD